MLDATHSGCNFKIACRVGHGHSDCQMQSAHSSPYALQSQLMHQMLDAPPLRVQTQDGLQVSPQQQRLRDTYMQHMSMKGHRYMYVQAPPGGCGTSQPMCIEVAVEASQGQGQRG
jgi:hypothetical protein